MNVKKVQQQAAQPVAGTMPCAAYADRQRKGSRSPDVKRSTPDRVLPTVRADSMGPLLDKLFARTSHLIKLDLDCVRALLHRLGDPQEGPHYIHVAGTNGKGSVCAMIESVLRAAGYRTGLYTSPHLVRFNERIQVGGEPIADKDLNRLGRIVEEADRAGERSATFFEFTTALAFEYFHERAVEMVVLETGMGGRLDATNVVTPLVSVITSIGLEHTAYLGTTLADIAAEKGGIIKPGCPVICGALPEDARVVMETLARVQQAPLVPAEQAVSVQRRSQTPAGQKVKVESQAQSYPVLTLPLLGRFQLKNMALAVAALETLRADGQFDWDDAALKKGFADVKWPARCQVLETAPLTILDVAHNPPAARELVETLEDLVGKRPLGLVAGLLSDKDAEGFFKILAPRVRACWLVPIASERNMPMPLLKTHAQAAGLEPMESDLKTAFPAARAWAIEQNGVVLVAGSLFLAGELLGRLEKGEWHET